MSPILPPHAIEIISRSTEQTQRIGMRLGALLQMGDLVGLVGDLGTGFPGVNHTSVQALMALRIYLDEYSLPSEEPIQNLSLISSYRFYQIYEIDLHYRRQVV